MEIAKRIAVLAVASVFAISGLVGAVDWPMEFDWLTPKDATDIERVDFSKDGKLELLFAVKRSYPDFTLGREQYDKLIKNGWTECRTKTNEWFRYFDASAQAEPNSRCRYVFSKNFMKGPHLLLVMQHRYSKHQGVESCPAVPDNNDIDVTILHEKFTSPQQLKSAEPLCGSP